jgi:hypothetical protein
MAKKTLAKTHKGTAQTDKPSYSDAARRAQTPHPTPTPQPLQTQQTPAAPPADIPSTSTGITNVLSARGAQTPHPNPTPQPPASTDPSDSSSTACRHPLDLHGDHKRIQTLREGHKHHTQLLQHRPNRLQQHRLQTSPRPPRGSDLQELIKPTRLPYLNTCFLTSYRYNVLAWALKSFTFIHITPFIHIYSYILPFIHIYSHHTITPFIQVRQD